MMLTPAQRAFLHLSMQAKIHRHLDDLPHHHRRMMHKVEQARPVQPAPPRIEALKKEVFSIRFG